ncbi:MAG TPA: hypothetical protein VG734_25470 [Lacunisphaera sp.]|nr:hypothetical protein [Lacunisphaera sp.]
MSIILSTLRDLARTLGCGDHQVETVVREERSARAALSRRGLFQAAGAVAYGLAFAMVPQQRYWRNVAFYVNGEKVATGFAAFDTPAPVPGDFFSDFRSEITVMFTNNRVPSGAVCLLEHQA